MNLSTYPFGRVLLSIFVGDITPAAIVLTLLFWAGLWKVFTKSGVKGWWALIPCARDYMLGKCAGREPEGRVVSLVSFTIMILQIITYGLSSDSMPTLAIAVFMIMLYLIGAIYHIRIYEGLCEVYGVRKRWIWLTFLQATKWIPMVVWGFNKKYQPEWKVEDLKKELSGIVFGKDAAVMAEGLTVNLTERSAVEFFQKKILLRDIHMYIPQGHMVLLLGGSGAGKTTYLNAINGYEKAKAEVVLNGENLYKHYKRMQYQVGFVPQQELMRPKDTVFNTLMDAARLRLPQDVSGSVRRERVEEVMGIFGLKPVRSNLVEKLSGGQKKRLSIAMEFLSNPSLFILDEPDSGLDGVMARELMQQLRKIADTGKIVIVITHTPDRVIDLFDDVIVLAKDAARTGRLAFYGSIQEARTFFGREKMEEIVKSINRKEEGGDGLADEFIMKYAEVNHA